MFLPMSSCSNFEYVGKPLGKARALADHKGVPHRVVKADGESDFVTMDYLHDRVNFTTWKGIVIRATGDGP